MCKTTREIPVILFFVLSYIFSWGAWLPMVLSGEESRLLLIIGTFGPGLSALLLCLWNNGKQGLRYLFGGVLVRRVHWFYYLFALFSTMVFVLAALFIYKLAGGTGLVYNDIREVYLVIPVFFYVLFLSVAGEEFGWRGFALPRLQTRFSSLFSSIILGLVWGFWHLPLFLIPGNFHSEISFGLFVLQDVALSIVITWLYNRTGRSLLLVFLFHAASNTTIGVLPVLPMQTGGETGPLYILIGLLCVFAAALAAVYGPPLHSRGESAVPAAD